MRRCAAPYGDRGGRSSLGGGSLEARVMLSAAAMMPGRRIAAKAEQPSARSAGAESSCHVARSLSFRQRHSWSSSVCWRSCELCSGAPVLEYRPARNLSLRCPPAAARRPPARRGGAGTLPLPIKLGRPDGRARWPGGARGAAQCSERRSRGHAHLRRLDLAKERSESRARCGWRWSPSQPPAQRDEQHL